MNSRAIATQILWQVLAQNKSLTAVLPASLAQHPRLRDPQLVQEMCYGVLRHYEFLQAILAQLVSKPLRAKDEDIHLLLLIGLYQLQFLQVPPPAAISETVNAAKLLNKNWAASLVNASLRNFLRKQEALHATLASQPLSLSVQFNHPQWLIDAIAQAWPDHWQSILEANNQHPPMVLRVNTSKVSRDDYLLTLQQAGIDANPHPIATTAIILTRAVSVQKLPGFTQGLVSVQDAASQLVAACLNLTEGLTVLDACAAPGGKTCHMLEQQSKIKVTALDIDAQRITKIAENLQRLQLQATLLTADACQPESWWDGQQFDRILCDAPCSATGVIRRHPDIKYLRQASDIAELSKQQATILHKLWPLLASGGRLVYSTCSILPAENDAVIAAFIAQEPTAKIIHANIDCGIITDYGQQLLPGQHQMDGFYFAIIEKQ